MNERKRAQCPCIMVEAYIVKAVVVVSITVELTHGVPNDVCSAC